EPGLRENSISQTRTIMTSKTLLEALSVFVTSSGATRFENSFRLEFGNNLSARHSSCYNTGVNLWMVLRFVFGNADAIRAVSRNRAALWTSIVLVLLTGVARNYDQTFFLESPMWLIGPLVFSFFSGSFLYVILIRGFARRHFPEENRK